MKKIVFSGLAASMVLVAPAFAEITNDSLTTKGYVDSGLRALYSTTKTVTDGLGERVTSLEGIVGENATSGLRGSVATLQNDVTSIETALVGNDGNGGLNATVNGLNTAINGTNGEGGLAAAVTQLQTTVQAFQTNGGDTTAYTAGENGGITISNHQVSITGLADTKTVENKDDLYVYKDGTLEKLSVVKTWNPSFNFAGE